MSAILPLPVGVSMPVQDEMSVPSYVSLAVRAEEPATAPAALVLVDVGANVGMYTVWAACTRAAHRPRQAPVERVDERQRSERRRDARAG